jgi:hypothetical protein
VSAGGPASAPPAGTAAAIPPAGAYILWIISGTGTSTLTIFFSMQEDGLIIPNDRNTMNGGSSRHVADT